MNTELLSGLNPEEYKNPFEHLDIKKEHLPMLSLTYSDEDGESVEVIVSNRYRVTDITMEAYKAIPAVRQSTLKDVFDDPSKVDKEYDQNKGMELGSLVDSIIAGTFKEDYFVGGETSVSDTMKAMIEEVFNIQKQQAFVDNSEIPDYMEEATIMLARDKFQWNMNWGKDTIVKHFNSGSNKGTQDGLDYYNFLLLADGKIIVSQDKLDVAEDLSKYIKDNYGKILEDSGRQVAYVGDVRIIYKNKEVEMTLKALIDIDDESRVYDLKIIGRSLNLFGPFYYRGYGYKYQDTVYHLLTGKPFYFMCVSTAYPQAMFLRSLDEDENTGQRYFGNIISHVNERGYHQIGLATMIAEFKYYQKNGFTIPRSVRDNPVGTISENDEKYSHLTFFKK
jgi:hypothetical protein